MVGRYTYTVNQRVRIKTTNGGTHRPPSDAAKGGLGTIAPQMTSDWSGTRLALEPGTPPIYYVTIDGGATELIAEDWLEPAPRDAQ